jgi:hypothetical protein
MKLFFSLRTVAECIGQTHSPHSLSHIVHAHDIRPPKNRRHRRREASLQAVNCFEIQDFADKCFSRGANQEWLPESGKHR